MPYRILLTFSFAVVTAIAFTVGDYLVLDDIIPNRGPIWTSYGILKIIVASCIAVGIVASIYADGRSVHRAEAPPIASPGLVVMSFVAASAFVLLFLVSAPAFNWLGQEDNIIEYLSAVLCLLGAGLFLSAFVTARRSPEKGSRRRATLVIAPLGAVALFLIGMEEISWGQRILGFSTPESFAGNRQGEVNLHNFFTTPVHSIYRIGSWAVLILIPFMVTFGPRLRLFDTFGDVLPPPWVAAISVPIACFNYNAWPFLPTQVIAFSSVLMMAIFAVHAHRGGRREAALLFGAGAILMIVAQSVFLIEGDRFIRRWDVTEYQEFFMALGLAAMAWAAREQVRARSDLQPHLPPHVVKP